MGDPNRWARIEMWIVTNENEKNGGAISLNQGLSKKDTSLVYIGLGRQG